MAVTYPCYLQQKDRTGDWYWIYYARNGEPIARSSESYVNRGDCSHAIDLVKGSSGHPVFYSG